MYDNIILPNRSNGLIYNTLVFTKYQSDTNIPLYCNSNIQCDRDYCSRMFVDPQEVYTQRCLQKL